MTAEFRKGWGSFGLVALFSDDQFAVQDANGLVLHQVLRERLEHVGAFVERVAPEIRAADIPGEGVHLAEVGGRWRFQTAPDLAGVLEEVRQEPRKLSQAALETLSIIAYHQPVTRAEIEEIRGVAVSKGTLDLLFELRWVRPRGRRHE